MTSKGFAVFGIIVTAVVLLLSSVAMAKSAIASPIISGEINKMISPISNGLHGVSDIPLPGTIFRGVPNGAVDEVGKTYASHGQGNSPYGVENSIIKTPAKSTSSSKSTTANTKCISNSPNGAKPHIVKQGNVIIGSDCDITIVGNNQGNIIFTGNGNDVVFGGTGNDIIYAGSGTDRIFGGKGNDILVAGSGNDLLDGGPGDDVLIGGTGNDLLIGGPGNDKLFAGTGTTVMDGGPGADHFDCGTSTTSKAIVMDYNPTDGDTISGNCKLVNTASNGDPSSSTTNFHSSTTPSIDATSPGSNASSVHSSTTPNSNATSSKASSKALLGLILPHHG